MKKVGVALFVAAIILAYLAWAAGADTIVLPSNVKELKSASFSPGGRDDMIRSLTLLCKMEDGSDRIFIVIQTAMSGFFGLNRWTLPDSLTIRYTGAVNSKAEWVE